MAAGMMDLTITKANLFQIQLDTRKILGGICSNLYLRLMRSME